MTQTENAGNFRVDGDIKLALEKYPFEYREKLYASHFLRARKSVLDYFVSLIGADDKVLDINCGTGIDAIEIAKRGHMVKAVDVSSTMISFLEEAVLQSGLAGRVTGEVCDYRDLRTGGEKFDAILSNFGGINFASDLDRVFDSLANVVAPAGKVVITSVSHFCFMETLIFLVHGQMSKAMRRPTGGTAKIGGEEVKMYYHTKKNFVSEGRKHGFELVDLWGLNILSPPLWADDFYVSHNRLADLLERIDVALRHLPLARVSGDFTLYVFQKTNA